MNDEKVDFHDLVDFFVDELKERRQRSRGEIGVQNQANPSHRRAVMVNLVPVSVVDVVGVKIATVRNKTIKPN